MSSKTPVTILQEFMVRRHETPSYTLICNESRTHEPLFKFLVSGLGKSAVGSGKSKREAKHEAARLLLLMLKFDVPDLKENALLKEVDACFSPYDDTIKDNAVGALQLFCCDYQLKNPVYDLIMDIGPPHSKLFTIKCSVSSFSCEATARTKKQAKHRCSYGLLQKLKICLSNFIDFTENNEDNPYKETVSCELAKRTACLGYSLSDMCHIFTSTHYPSSPVLQELKNKNLEEISTPLETLKIIAEELNFALDISVLPSSGMDIFIVNIFLIAKPGWSFIGTGSSYDAAVDSACIEALEFLVIMSSN